MTDPPQKKIVGVLGGMGPYATLAFFKAVLDLTPAKKDWDHVHLVIDNNPHIPSRTRYLLYREASPFDGMLDSCRRLQDYPVNAIAVPCNSAAIFVPDLRKELRIPIFDICQVTAEALAEDFPSTQRAAVLGGYVTYAQRTYERFLESKGIELVDHGPEIQDSVARLIEELKLGHAQAKHTELLKALIRKIVHRTAADVVILGCTELNMLVPFDADVPAVDSSISLAKRLLAFASEGE